MDARPSVGRCGEAPGARSSAGLDGPGAQVKDGPRPRVGKWSRGTSGVGGEPDHRPPRETSAGAGTREGAMAEPKPLTAYWMHDVIRISEPMTIGKHAWRLVQYRDTTSRYVTDETTGIRRLVETPVVFVGYEWRRLDERFEDWRQARDWPRYDFNNGQTLGLPITLRKLYDACPWAHPCDAGGGGDESPSDDGTQESRGPAR